MLLNAIKLKTFILLLSSLLAADAFSQEQEIYHLSFSDTDNFRMTTSFYDKRPDTVYILDTTQCWNPDRFWLKDLDRNLLNTKFLSRDEHHPYHHTYLFRDKELDKLFSKQQKKSLQERSSTIVSKNITINGPYYKTIASSENITGFYFVSTEPLFDSNGHYAFIDLLVYRKEFADQPIPETYFGTICIVFEKQEDDSWKKIKVMNHVIL